MGYFDGDGYFGAAPKLPPNRPILRRRGLGLSLDPGSAAAAAGSAPGYAQQTAAQYQAQGQALYNQANTYAVQAQAAGQQVSQGNLSGVVAGANLAANNVPPGSAQNVLKQIAAVGAEAAIGYTMSTALITEGLAVAGIATAAEVASVVPVFGTYVAAMIVVFGTILAKWGANQGTVVTMPPVGQALLNTPLPIPTTATGAAAGMTPGAIEPQVADPTAKVAAGSTCAISSYAGGGANGGLMGPWRFYLEGGQAPDGMAFYNACVANHAEIPLPPTGIPGTTDPPGSSFSSGCATWQACADRQLGCVAYGLGSIGGGQPMAEQAAALAIRWVPYGDLTKAPYDDTGNVLAGWSVEQGLESNLLALAYAYAAWPQKLADQQALAYLTTLAWVWNNYPGNSGPLPPWIAYKLGYLSNLVAQDAIIQPASGASAGSGSAAASSTTGQTAAAVGLGLVGAGAAGIGIYSVMTKQAYTSVAKGLVKGVWVKLKKL